MLDRAGLKGLARGAAEVSSLHANFVVNRGGATARDVLALLDEVNQRVGDACGLELRREIVVWRPGAASGRLSFW